MLTSVIVLLFTTENGEYKIYTFKMLPHIYPKNFLFRNKEILELEIVAKYFVEFPQELLRNQKFVEIAEFSHCLKNGKRHFRFSTMTTSFYCAGARNPDPEPGQGLRHHLGL
jgi:hypothetical protein